MLVRVQSGALMLTDLQVGDVITAYHKGYWRVVEIQRRFLTKDDLRFSAYKDCKVGDEYSPLIRYELVMDTKGNKPKGKAKTNVCDARYCSKLTREWVEEQKQAAVAQWDAVLGILPHS